MHLVCLENILWKVELQQMYYSYDIGDSVHFLQFDCSGSGLSVLSSLAQQLPSLDKAISRWLSVFYCLWADLSTYKEAALQSHPYWPSVSLIACVQFLSFPSDKNQLPPVFLKISQWNHLILMQVILRLGKSSLRPGILPIRHSQLPQLCAQFCLTSLERLRQGVWEASVWLVTFYYGLWSLIEGLRCPRLSLHQEVHQQRYGFHVSIPDVPAFPVISLFQIHRRSGASRIAGQCEEGEETSCRIVPWIPSVHVDLWTKCMVGIVSKNRF